MIVSPGSSKVNLLLPRPVSLLHSLSHSVSLCLLRGPLLPHLLFITVSSTSNLPQQFNPLSVLSVCPLHVLWLHLFVLLCPRRPHSMLSLAFSEESQRGSVIIVMVTDQTVLVFVLCYVFTTIWYHSRSCASGCLKYVLIWYVLILWLVTL